jgi:hypothetical protein
MPIVATGVVVDAIAVANGEAVPGAIPPDRALHKPGKRRGKSRIELASIDLGREQAENAGAPSRPVAPVAVRMVRAQPPQDPSSVQKEPCRCLLLLANWKDAFSVESPHIQ